MLSCDPVGMGAFREVNKNGDMEIKRMYIPIKYRGKGFSKMILKEFGPIKDQYNMIENSWVQQYDRKKLGTIPIIQFYFCSIQ